MAQLFWRKWGGPLVLSGLLAPLGAVVSSCGLVIGLDDVDRVQCVGACAPDAGGLDGTLPRADGSGAGSFDVRSVTRDTGFDSGGTYDALTTADGAPACHADADCTDPLLPRCDRNSGTCVVCLPTGTNTCPTGQICKLFATSYMCAAGCITSVDCPATDGGAAETCCNTVCVDTATNPGNCGGCGVTCSSNNIPVVTCGLGLCNGACAPGFADCNANKLSDGCETSVGGSDPDNCGACATSCSGTNVVAPTCSGGTCTSKCSPGFADCDHDLQADGCETQIDGSDVSNCGGCGVACSTANVSPVTCSAGVCDGPCTAGFADCDNNKQSDGCETQINGSDCNNCGACGATCGGCEACEGGNQVFVCCPYVFAYDGDGFVYETSIGGASVVGRKSHAKTGKDLDFAPLWVRMDHSKVDWSSGAGVVRSKVIAAEDEIVYFDEAFLTAVAHPVGYEVVSSSAIEWEQTLHAKDPREFYVLRTAGLRTPVRATWMGRVDVTRELTEKDEVPAAFDTALGNYYDVDFGPARESASRWLVVDGWKFKQPRELAPGVGKDKPALLVRQLDGSWAHAKDLATPKGDKKAVAFDLSGIRFPTGRLEMRIVTGTHEDGHAMWYLDRVRLSEEDASLGEATPVPLETATLEFMGPPSVQGPLEFWHPVHAKDDGRGELGDKYLTYGAFTRYGDVRALLAAPDDEMVVMRRGDGVELRFVGVPAARPGEEVSLFLETDLLFKPRVLFGVGTKEMEEVLPLPYHGMGHYPPPAPFPRDAEHDAWQATYETRVYERGDTRWGE